MPHPWARAWDLSLPQIAAAAFDSVFPPLGATAAAVQVGDTGSSTQQHLASASPSSQSTFLKFCWRGMQYFRHGYGRLHAGLRAAIVKVGGVRIVAHITNPMMQSLFVFLSGCQRLERIGTCSPSILTVPVSEQV